MHKMSWRSSNFGSSLEHLKNRYFPLFLGSKDMHRRLNVFDFGHIQTSDIGVTWPWTIAFYLNYSNYFDKFICWLSGELP